MHAAKVGVIVVLALLTLAGASATPAPETHTRAHPPIVIVGDAGFLLPGSGVRSGSGTEADPFVIAHWTIAQPTALTGALGIVLMGTSAHVLVKDVEILGPACQVECPFYEAVRIEGARNVVLEDVRVHHFEIGLTILDSRDVAVDGFSHRGGPDPRFFGDANRVLNSADVTLAGLHTESLGWRNLLIQDSSGVAVAGARFGPSAYPNWDAGTVTVARSTDVAFRGSEFRGADLTLGRGVDKLVVETTRSSTADNSTRGPPNPRARTARSPSAATASRPRATPRSRSRARPPCS
ncbi:MAG TPA: hypothetical protein VM889_09465 [Candidatus Thermoplasmatota archaeon]|nr:hypothetical protein [Candidatus Thermoplasmatota archaeon]